MAQSGETWENANMELKPTSKTLDIRNENVNVNVMFNPLKPSIWERLVLPGGGPQGPPPLEINEGVSGEQDSLNTIFNTHKIRIVCKIWSSYFIVHARARSF